MIRLRCYIDIEIILIYEISVTKNCLIDFRNLFLSIIFVLSFFFHSFQSIFTQKMPAQILIDDFIANSVNGRAID